MILGELNFIEEQIQQYSKAIETQQNKINRIRKEFLYEPLYEIQIQKRLKAKLYALKYKREKILATNLQNI